MKHLAPIVFAFVFYACSTSQAGDASGADAAEEAARLTYLEPTVNKVGVVPVKRGSFELKIVHRGYNDFI